MTVHIEKTEQITVAELLYIRQLVLSIKGDMILRFFGMNVYGWKSV